MALVAATATLLAGASSCASAPSPAGAAQDGERTASSEPARADGDAREPQPYASVTTEAVVLVTIDGVRWQEVFAGVDEELGRRAGLPPTADSGPRALVPNLYRLFFDEGTVLGAPGEGEGIEASGPRYVSLPAYLELMTGAPATCWANDCNPLVAWTLAEALAAGGPSSSAVYASWDRIGDVFREARGVTVDAGRAADDEGAAHPGIGRYQPDRSTAKRAIEHLVQQRPRFLWVALGDTDEWAHRGDYRGYLDALRFADAFVGELTAHLAEMPGYGEQTSVFVTTDHGRDASFADHGARASASVWLMARGPGIAARGAIGSPAPRRLRDVAPTILALFGQPAQACESCGRPIAELVEVPANLRGD